MFTSRDQRECEGDIAHLHVNSEVSLAVLSAEVHRLALAVSECRFGSSRDDEKRITSVASSRVISCTLLCCSSDDSPTAVDSVCKEPLS